MFIIYIRKTVTSLTLAAFLVLNAVPVSAQNFMGAQNLPVPGARVLLSTAYVPVILKGIKVDVRQPFKFDFVMDTGNSQLQDAKLQDEANKLIRYFLASLAIPDKDLWVNLSPYEKDRIIADEFSLTEMGRDLLAQDYILKQITASLIYPEGVTGKAFWSKVYALAYEKYGTTDVPIETFNKVWIIPAEATVYESPAKDAQTATAFITGSRLKVMLESDYQLIQGQAALEVKDNSTARAVEEAQEMAQKVMREVVIPVLEQEVNEGANFAMLRQVYQSLILAKWYKETLKASILNRKYSDQRKVEGVDLADRQAREDIYQRYIASFQQGAFNYIKEEVDLNSQEVLPRQYFSGGFDLAQLTLARSAQPLSAGQNVPVGKWVSVVGDFAMTNLPATLPQINPADMVFPVLNNDGAIRREDQDQAQSLVRSDEKRRAVLDNLIRQIAWASDLLNDFLDRGKGEVVKVVELRKVLTQLRNVDVLGSMLNIENGQNVITWGRSGTTESRNGTKDLNTVLGEHGNNVLIRVVRQELRKLMEAQGFSLEYDTFNRFVFSYSGVDKDLKLVLNGVQADLLAAVNRLLSTEEYKDIGEKLQSEGISINKEFLSFGVNKAEIDDQADPVEKAKQQIASFVKAQQALAMSRVDGVVGEIYDSQQFDALINRNQALNKELSGLMEGFTPKGETVAFQVLQGDVSKVLREQLTWSALQQKVAAGDALYVGVYDKIGNEETYGKAQTYFNQLSAVDFIKTWQLNLKEALDWRNKILDLTQRLEQSITSARDGSAMVDVEVLQMLNELKDVLSKDPKAPDDIKSVLAFYAEAVKLNDFGIVSLDVINMGGMNIREFEILMQKMYQLNSEPATAAREVKKRDLLQTAADAVTEGFQNKFKSVLQYLQEKKIAFLVGRIGGDEAYFLLKSCNDLTPELLADIQRLTATRVAGSKAVKYYLDGFVDRHAASVRNGVIIKAKHIPEDLGVASVFAGMDDGFSRLKEAEKRQTSDQPKKTAVALQDAQGVWGMYVEDPKDPRKMIEKTDPAQTTASYGGIDLNSALLNLTTQGQRTNLDWSTANGQGPEVNINGLVPMILNIQPMQDLAGYLLATNDPLRN